MPTREVRWQGKFAVLEAFLTEHRRLPRFFAEDDKAEESLGTWIRSQRKSHVAGRLTVRQINMLRALPVRGVLEKVTADDWIGDLEDFHSAHGRLPKSTAPEGSPERRLGHYLVHTLRPAIKAGKLPPGLASRAARIPGATQFTYKPDQDDRVEALRAFIAEAGHLPRYHLNVPDTERSLGQWMNNLMVTSDQRKSAAVLARIAAVRQIIATTPRRDDLRVEEAIAHAEKHVADHGHLPRPFSGDTIDASTYRWLQRRRSTGDADLYGPELAARIRALLEIPTTYDGNWDNQFAALQAFLQEHGRLPRGPHDGTIHKWLSTQRARYRKGLLALIREHRLRTVPGVLPPADGE